MEVLNQSSTAKMPHHNDHGITSSEFELGMAALSKTRQVTSDSPIKVPKVAEDFSQDTLSQLNIKGVNAFVDHCV